MITGIYYSFNEIENFAFKNSYELEELGKKIVGQNFIVLYNDALDITISFVLTRVGVSGVDYSYLCVYNY